MTTSPSAKSDGADERRKHLRGRHEDHLVIKVLNSTEDRIAPGRTLFCATRDVSREGLRLATDHEVPEDTHVELWVIAKHRAGTIVLTGTIAWCRKNADGKGYEAGVAIDRKPATNFLEWQVMAADIATGGG